MIFVTGDTHGDFTRFRTDIFPEQADMTKEDYVIICGDFGLWDDSTEEHEKLDWLEDKPFTTLFVAGNHSNYDLLATFPVSEWRGGKDSIHYHYGRESMHHLLYSVANSKALNGVAPGGTVIEGMPTYQKTLIAVDMVAALLIAGLVWFIIRGFRKKKKSTQAT